MNIDGKTSAFSGASAVHIRQVGSNTERAAMMQLAMTSMIDVVFLLLICFLFSPGRIPQGFIRAEVIASRFAPASQSRAVWITLLRKNGKLLLAVNERQAKDWQQLGRLLRRRLQRSASQEPIVIIDAARGVSFGMLMRAWQTARQAGAETVAIAGTRKKP